MNTERKPFTFDRVARIFFTLLIVWGIIFIATKIKDALLPFLISWLIAYMLNPMVGFFQYKLHIRNRLISILATLLTAFILIGGIVWALIPTLSNEFDRLQILINYYQANGGFINLIPSEWSSYFQQNINPDKMISSFTSEDIGNLIKQIAPNMWMLLTNSFSLVVGFFASAIILLYLVFILLDFDRITNGFISLFPEKYQTIADQLLKDISDSMNRYFRGQALVAFLVGVLCSIGFSIISLPMGIFLGMLIGALNMVPYMQIIGLVPMALLSLLKSAETGNSFWAIFGMAIGVLAIVQIIQDTLLVPKIMGKVTGLNPAIILLSLSIWGSLMGIMGLIIGLPLTTLCLSYYKRYILREFDIKNSTSSIAENELDSSKAPSNKE
ncbi:MAG: AI-2E family transporter [Bacteroidales bacterium]|nr:AI-2E family transporter [Bacteroidales bacterium]